MDDGLTVGIFICYMARQTDRPALGHGSFTYLPTSHRQLAAHIVHYKQQSLKYKDSVNFSSQKQKNDRFTATHLLMVVAIATPVNVWSSDGVETVTVCVHWAVVSFTAVTNIDKFWNLHHRGVIMLTLATRIFVLLFIMTLLPDVVVTQNSDDVIPASAFDTNSGRINAKLPCLRPINCTRKRRF